MLKESKTLLSIRLGETLFRVEGAVIIMRNADYIMKEALNLSGSVQLDPLEVEGYQD